MNPATSLRFPWKQLLLRRPDSWVKLTRAGCEVPQGSTGRNRVVLVSRSLLRYKSFKLDDVPPAERMQVLKNQARAWEPFSRSEVRVGIKGARGVAIAWDADLLSRRLEELGQDGLAVHLCLESLHREPLANGVRLLRGIDGYEAEHWVDAVLNSSRWWPEAPTPLDWEGFVRSLGPLGLDPQVTQMPDVQTLPPLGHGWITLTDGIASVEGFGQTEALVVQGLVAICAAVSAVVAHQFWEVHSHVELAKEELTTLRTSNASTLMARDKAMALSAQASQLASVMNGIQPLDVLQHLARLLPKEVIVKELELNGGNLRLALQVPEQHSLSTLIKTIQSGGWLRDVRDVKSTVPGSTMALEMRIDGLRQPVVAPAASAPAVAPEARPGRN